MYVRASRGSMFRRALLFPHADELSFFPKNVRSILTMVKARSHGTHYGILKVQGSFRPFAPAEENLPQSFDFFDKNDEQRTTWPRWRHTVPGGGVPAGCSGLGDCITHDGGSGRKWSC